MADIKIGDIAVYEDDDGKAVWEFEGKVQSNTTLDTEAQDFAGAINELKKLSAEGGGDDWQPPAEWIPVPEPGEYDIYILIWATKTGYQNTGMNFDLLLRDKYNNEQSGDRHIYCDWGDGTNDYLERGDPHHTYTEQGQYLVHITTDGNITLIVGYNAGNQARWQIFKSGEKIIFYSDDYIVTNRIFAGGGIKFIQANSFPTDKISQFFYGCGGLKKIKSQKKLSGNISDYTFQADYGLNNFPIDTESVELVGNSAFASCYGLKTLSLPNVTSIGNSAFASCYGLESIYLPNCTSIGSAAFSGCYNLQKIVVAENCTFGTNCFQNCYSLFPRPDGSVN